MVSRCLEPPCSLQLQVILGQNPCFLSFGFPASHWRDGRVLLLPSLPPQPLLLFLWGEGINTGWWNSTLSDSLMGCKSTPSPQKGPRHLYRELRVSVQWIKCLEAHCIRQWAIKMHSRSLKGISGGIRSRLFWMSLATLPPQDVEEVECVQEEIQSLEQMGWILKILLISVQLNGHL